MRDWIRRRQGPDSGAVTLRRGRIYILPTGLGTAFGLMLFAMLLGSLNYGNNLGLGLTFLLAALGIVAMHACHRNLEALIVRAGSTEPPFAGGEAVFRLEIVNPGRASRCDLEAVAPGRADPPASIAAGGETRRRHARADSPPRQHRARAHRDCDALSLRALPSLGRDASGCRLPRLPAARRRRAAAAAGAGPCGQRCRRGAAKTTSRDSRTTTPATRRGTSPGRRTRALDELLVKEFSGDAEAMPLFDLSEAPGVDLEARLSVLARWIVDAHARGQTFGLRLPGDEIPPVPGAAQRRRCLAALARFGAPVPDVA